MRTTQIHAGNVRRLAVRWRFPLRGRGGNFGAITSTPVTAGGTLYFQDSKSSVFAVALETGQLLWARILAAPNDGPNGVAVGGGRVFAATDTTAFALDAATGRRLWSRRLADRDEQFVNIAPVADRGRIYVSTVGFPPGGRGALYALSAETGRVLWKFDTIKNAWPHPIAGGGGVWSPVSVDGAGDVYAGVANPGPWGGSRPLPNGEAFRGSTLYTDSLVVLDGATGRLVWHDQVTRHDVRDYDFHLSPILASVTIGGRARQIVVGGGKAGRIIAWDRASRRRLWARAVGTHLRDIGPLPGRPVRVCPGLFGGALTPMAYASGTVYVPVVELCMKESGLRSLGVLQRPPESGKGLLYALDGRSGAVRWSRAFGSPLFGCATVARDVVIVPAFDGTVYGAAARSGRILWKHRLRAGINSCPAVSGDTVVVGAGAPHRDFPQPRTEVVAFRLR